MTAALVVGQLVAVVAVTVLVEFWLRSGPP
ncbi:MAG: hypothetical protein JWM89_1525 [Acidimicrobiales bacterium]|nr:hypothetical protein [Acidimicrobiales bacterium]